MVLNGAVSLITWAGCSKNVPCVDYVGLPVVVGSWLLLSPLWVSLTLRLVDCEAQTQAHHANCCTSAQHIVVPAVISLWICWLWSPFDPALVLSKAGHLSWSGLPRVSLLQANVRRCPHPALSKHVREEILTEQLVGPPEPRGWVCLWSHPLNVPPINILN